MLLYELHGPEQWDKINKTMRKAGYTELGSGVDSTVWGKDEGRVIKILMPESGDLTPAEKVFLAYYETAQKYSDNPHMMKFVPIGGQHYTKFDINGEIFYQIAVEKLQPLPDGSFEEAVVWAMSECVANRLGWPDAYQKLTNPKSKIWQYYEGDSEAVAKKIATSKRTTLKYLYLTMQLMYHIGRKQGFGWDLHTENAMLRNDGTIVITDPWYSSMLDENFTRAVTEGSENLSYIGNCTDDDVIEHIFGDATGFAQAVEEHGDEFTIDDLVVKYDPETDVHSFYYKKQGVAEGKIKLSTDPNWYGAEVGDYKASGPIVNIPANRLVGFEPDDKMNQPASKSNVEKIVAGLKQGAKLPPLLVRQYKNGYQVLDGHHRFWAYKLLGVKSIPAQVVPAEDIEEITKQGVAEAFDKPYKGKWEHGDDGHDMLVRLPDGSNLSIMFNLDYGAWGDEEWTVEFWRNNSQEVTGEGDQQRIFATVLSAIQKFINKYHPERLRFSANKDVEPGQKSMSRTNLYNRLVQRYANSWGYEVDIDDFADTTVYNLYTMNEGVAEGTLNEYRNALYDFVKSKFPTWPEYVLKDFLYAQAKGIRDEEELKDWLERNQKDFGRVKWRLEKLPITLDIFTPRTQRMIKQREGGSSNPFQVPRDAERHAQQLKMIQQQGVRTEPIIVAKLSNGYDLIEGWHRTIQHLQQYPEGYTGPAWVAYGATYTSESKQGVAERKIFEINAADELTIPDELVQRFTNAGWQIVGEGRDQIVLGKPNSRYVLKIVGQGSGSRIDQIRRYIDFYRQNQQNPHWPRVGGDRTLKWGDKTYYAYTQEKLKHLPGDEAVLDYLEYAMEKIGHGREPDFAKIPQGLSARDIDGLMYAVDALFAAGIGDQYQFDLSNVYNIMQRDNGQLVIVDPFAGWDDDELTENTDQAAVAALLKKHGWSMGKTSSGDLAFTWEGNTYTFYGERMRITSPDGKYVSVVWGKPANWQGRPGESSFAQAVQNKYLTFDLPIWQALDRGQISDIQALQQFAAENERQAREALAQSNKA